MKKIKLLYGISNFKKLITDGYYYIDKTKYIEQKQIHITLFTLNSQELIRILKPAHMRAF
jgi:hypothetical protein